MIWGLVNTASNSKEFCFGTGDMNRIMDSLGNRVIVCVHMQYKYNNVVFDAGICNNDSSRGEVW